MTVTKFLTQCLLLRIVVVCTTEVVSYFPGKNSFGDSFTNIAFYNGITYIGAKNYIYVLNASDLSEVYKARTCKGECDNINKVLMVNKMLDQLITCGTGNNGSCKIRALNTTVDLLGRSTTDDKDNIDYLVVSTDEKRPSSFVLIEKTGGIYSGITYGYGLKTHKIIGEGNTYFSYLSSYSLTNNGLRKEKSLQLKLGNGEDVQLENYLVYFKAGFELDGFVYFVTNQKFKLADRNFTSKLIRICQNDTHLQSYTDIKLECETNGTVYNLIQYVSVFEPGEDLRRYFNATGKIMAATFASGSNPESPASQSAVCLYWIEDINRNIMQAKKEFITCSDNNAADQNRYLSYNMAECINSDKYREDSFRCSRDLPKFTYITGDENSSLSGHLVYTLSSDHNSGYLCKIATYTAGKYTVMLTGTSSGQLIKLNINTAQAYMFEEKDVDKGHHITGIHPVLGGKIEYVVSERRVVRFEKINCSYPTCSATMEAKNPLCGWCVYKMRSTFKENSTCPYESYQGHWLSSLTECLSLDVSPKGIPIESTKRVSVGITIPQSLNNDAYECKFSSTSESITGYSKATQEGGEGNFKCKSSFATVHSEGQLEFYVNHNGTDIFLAKTDFLFFDCGHFNKCGDCTGDKRAKCSWDSLKTNCIAENLTSIWFIQENTSCPVFQSDADKHYIPNDVGKKLTFNVSNLVNHSAVKYQCRLQDRVVDAIKENDNQISCTLQVSDDSEKDSEYEIEIIYGISSTSKLDGKNTVVVYNCEKLDTDCSLCRSLRYDNFNYECQWCSGSCIYSNVTCNKQCDPAEIITVIPSTAGRSGNITVTVNGKNLGAKFDEVNNISLAGVLCILQPQSYLPSKRITCRAGKADSVLDGVVDVFVNSQKSTGNVRFSYKEPQLTEVTPERGPEAGGTRINITGYNLGIGTRKIIVYVTNTTQEKKECTNSKVIQDIDLENTTGFEFWIECDSPGAAVGEMLESVEIVFEGGTNVQKTINFTYLENPEIEGMIPMKGIASGGNRLTITGRKFKHADKGYVSGKNEKIPCTVRSESEMICYVPKLSAQQINVLNGKINRSRKKREATSSDPLLVEIVINLDGVERNFSIFYYRDPSLSYFEEDSKVKLFEPYHPKLTIEGEYLNLVADKGDVDVTIGLDNCRVVELKENNLTCLAPTRQPAASVVGASLPEVNVSIGNIRSTVGYLQYVETQEQARLWIIIAAALGSLLAVVVIVVVALVMKFKQKTKKMRAYKRHLDETEMEVKQIFREEFADIHTSMLSVNNSLIEQGFPYHHYQQYVLHLMFPADDLKSQSLLQEQEGTISARSNVKKGMEEFESLIFNKYFLLSVILSLEKQRKFGLKDKANMSGYICTILMGRMEYLQEILVDLLGNLVQESAGRKNQKVLFRRCETVTEKLLTNWLSLSLYPHLKSQSGCPLYLLYKSTQLHMESGPIDAITNDAKYTLSEEKLLKKYSQHSEQCSDEPTFEAKSLTLNVVVDNCLDIKICRVLDCDTISQVKDKCLTQIYMNYPASNLTVSPEDLEIEWHAGRSGCLRLRDKDNTSKGQGSWQRLNTLAHYNVQDGSNMALIDPQFSDASQNQDYANLAQVGISSPNNRSMDDRDIADTFTQDGKGQIKYWHIVKPEDGTLAAGKTQIAELYLNRLFTFKQSILKYICAIFDTILKEDILPPHVRFLYHLLDDLAVKNNVEDDTLHAWKSMSYPVRIWATLMKKPAIVFDINSPPYVDTSLDVISQVFIECFSLETPKLSKGSPTHKLIFTNEMCQYKERVKRFYESICLTESPPDSLREYLEEVNKLQQQHTNFNRMSALHELFQQIKPYIENVIEDLSNNREACNLQLDKKLEQILGLMGDE